MRVAVELVPRDAAAFEAQLVDLNSLSKVELVNVPDLAHFDIRAWEAAVTVRGYGDGRLAAVPHIRAMDIDLGREWSPALELRRVGVDEVLVVTGDPPSGMSHPVTGATALEVIEALKTAHPDWRIYAALDPYRSGFAAERDYAMRKLDAGADGFFTQPFFDLRLLAVWRELMQGVPVFWGVTSVTSQRSMRYWLARNRAVFPTGFEPTLAWHQRFAAEALAFAEHHDVDIYFMPIRVGIGDWLGELLG